MLPTLIFIVMAALVLSLPFLALVNDDEASVGPWLAPFRRFRVWQRRGLRPRGSMTRRVAGRATVV